MADVKSIRIPIVLEDGVSAPAKAAAGSLDGMRSSMEKDQAALSDLEKQLRFLNKTVGVGSEAYSKLEKQRDVARVRLKASAEAYLNAGGSLSKSNKDMGASSKTMSLITDATTAALATTAAACSAAAIAIAAVGTALAAATVSGLKFAISSSDSARSERLKWEAVAKGARIGENLLMTLYNFRWGGSPAADAGAKLYESVKNVSAQTAISKEEIGDFAKRLHQARFAGKELEEMLIAATTISSTLGKESADQLISMASQMRMFGVRTDDIAARVKSKFGPIMKAQMLSIGSQVELAKRRVNSIFSGLNTEEFLGATAKVLGILDQTKASGKALKALVSTIFDPMLKAITKLAPVVEDVFFGLIIGALDAAIGIKSTLIQLESVFEWANIFEDVDWFETARTSVSLIGDVISQVLLTLGELHEMFLSNAEELNSIFNVSELGNSGTKAAVALMTGLADGIRYGVRLALDAVAFVSKEIINEFKSTFQIHSPSRIGLALGGQMTAGIGLGMTKNVAFAASQATMTGNLIQDRMQSHPIFSASFGGADLAGTIGANVSPIYGTLPGQLGQQDRFSAQKSINQTINVTIQAADAAEITSESFVSKLSGVIEHACHDVAINLDATL